MYDESQFTNAVPSVPRKTNKKAKEEEKKLAVSDNMNFANEDLSDKP